MLEKILNCKGFIEASKFSTASGALLRCNSYHNNGPDQNLSSCLPILQISKTYTNASHLFNLFNPYKCTSTTPSTEAYLLFDETTHRNPISQNARISTHVRNGDPHAAWLLFLHMNRADFNLDTYTFTPVLSACSALFDAQRGRQAHSLLIKTGLGLETVVNTALVDMYTKCGSLDDAVRAFRETRSRDVVAWNAMISGLIRHGRAIDAVGAFQEMQKDGIGFSDFTLCSMLKACAALEALRQGKQIHALSIVVGGCNSVVWSTALVDFYSKCGLIANAFRVFDEMNCTKDEATYNTLLSGCVRNKKYEEVFLMLVRMQPNRIALTSVLDACSELLDLSKGKQIHCVAIRQGKNVVSWTSIIDAYGIHGLGVEAVEMFKKITVGSSGIAPNSVTLLAILSACGHSGLVEEARNCIVSAREKYSLDIGPEHYACFIDLLGRAGRIDEVWNLFCDMSTSTKQHAAVWAALLNACKTNLDVVRGEFAAKGLLELEPENPGNYVLLSNFYAAVGRWEAVEELRRVMREKGLRKEAGSSWVPLNAEMEILAGDSWVAIGC
ncbi:pentatricopeptide repeat-containing protein At5g66500, mitochondrial-like isoform X2 [Magnolia sinica]|uniref:pentatricopeptide repeat-containing protein At5g66500, mitochondrial-like isoform X2 n=1 Tax=Magnolia sinica TaxID=86752 RepID=UPI00265810A8|nr:pentatricopeptide repeat-containing protein At5g66500, mitochondrial-like isoform X2 [Magnolia sinica]